MSERPQRVVNIPLLASAAGVALIEVLAFAVGGAFAWLAARIWILLGAAFIAVSLWEIGRALRDQLRARSAWLLLVLGFSGAVTLWGIGSFDRIALDHESTQEVGAALRHLDRADLGHTQNSFLGYPNRQYLVAAAPTLVAGQSLAALRLGFALPFLLGIAIFWVGIYRALDNETPRAFLASCACLALFTMPYVLVSLFDYEQVLTPISYTLMATGWLLLMTRRWNAAAAVGLGWSGSMLGACYTPALASWALLVVALAVIVARRPRQPRASAAIAASLYVLAVGVCCLVTRTDILTDPQRRAEVGDWLSKLREAAEIFFLSWEYSFLGALLVFPVVIYLVLSLIFLNGWRHAAIAWWALATIAVGVVLSGYAEPPPHLSIKRGITALPPLFAGMALILSSWRWRSGWRSRLGRVAIAFVIAAYGAAAVQWELNRRPERAYSKLLPDLLESASVAGITPSSPIVVGVYSSEGDFGNLADFMLYFLPDNRFVFNRPPNPDELSGRRAIVYLQSGRGDHELEPWPALELKPFTYRFRDQHFSMRRGIEGAGPVDVDR